MGKPMIIEGFSSLPLGEKWQRVAEEVSDQQAFLTLIKDFRHEGYQDLLDQFSENTLTNYPLPYGIVPNVVVNKKTYMVPLVTEESSVVAAAAAAAKFWAWRGGFHANTSRLVKEGQVHFLWNGSEKEINSIFNREKAKLIRALKPLTASMDKRGGGIVALHLTHHPDIAPDYFRIQLQADTVNAMGANFINTLLETLATLWKEKVWQASGKKREVQIVMAILSNYTPDCLAEVYVSCPVDKLTSLSDRISGESLARKIMLAATIARKDPYRAVTHNKGIFNGIDAVALATGNDFRAIEACGHAWAARDGNYRALTSVSLDNNIFRLSMKIPFAVGTTGGLTDVHPLAARSLEILKHPSASELMMIMAAVGLASNFSAMRSLVTTGIQEGHMRLHLANLLIKYKATEEEKEKAETYFRKKKVSATAVKDFLTSLRQSTS